MRSDANSGHQPSFKQLGVPGGVLTSLQTDINMSQQTMFQQEVLTVIAQTPLQSIFIEVGCQATTTHDCAQTKLKHDTM